MTAGSGDEMTKTERWFVVTVFLFFGLYEIAPALAHTILMGLMLLGGIGLLAFALCYLYDIFTGRIILLKPREE